MISQRVGNINRAKDWRFQVAKDKRAAVTGRQTEEFSFGFGGAKLVGSAHDLAQFLNVRALLCGAQFGIADDVDEKDVRDLRRSFVFCSSGISGVILRGYGESLYMNFFKEKRVRRGSDSQFMSCFTAI